MSDPLQFRPNFHADDFLKSCNQLVKHLRDEVRDHMAYAIASNIASGCHLMDLEEKYDPVSQKVSITVRYFQPSIVITPRGSIFDLYRSFVRTTPRTDAQARARLPFEPGVQLLYTGLRTWGHTVEESYHRAQMFHKELCLRGDLPLLHNHR